MDNDSGVDGRDEPTWVDEKNVKENDYEDHNDAGS